MTKPMAAAAAALLTLLTLPLALDAGPLPRPQLSFEKNLGQTHESVDFTARGRRYGATLHAGSYSMALRTRRAGELPRWTLSPLERFARPPSTPWVISMYLVAANNEAAAEGLEPLAARSHYLRGNDRSKWQTDVPHYGRVRYKDVYPGIDIEYYGNSGSMEFDFLVRPGADPGRIRMDFEGAVSVEIDDDGDLVLRKEEHELRQRKPLVYQTVSGQRAEVEGSYNLEDDETVTFRLASYDTSRPLVIDPLIEWSGARVCDRRPQQGAGLGRQRSRHRRHTARVHCDKNRLLRRLLHTGGRGGTVRARDHGSQDGENNPNRRPRAGRFR